MHKAGNLRWWIAGAVVMMLLGAVVARPNFSPSMNTSLAVPSATVPEALLAVRSPSPMESTQPAPTALAVYVCGAVHHPGVYLFSSGVRVSDAIERAGGALADADLEQLNLAQAVTDAMKIDVPKRGQVVATALTQEALTPADGMASHRTRHRGGRSSHKLQPGQTLNINTATEAELTQLPGVGPGLARRIVEYRLANGPFQTVDDLQNVSGIGPAKFDRMTPYIHL